MYYSSIDCIIAISVYFDMFFCVFQVIQNILGHNIPWVSREI